MDYYKKPNGFTLIEVAIVLMVVGIISTAVFKGQDLIEAAKIRATVSEFQKIKLAFGYYQDTYGELPGDDPLASQRFGSSVSNGNGDKQIGESESNLVWVHMCKAGSLSSERAPTSKMGGIMKIITNLDGFSGHWLQLSGVEGGGLLTPKQALSIKSKLDDEGAAPRQGQLRILEGAGAASRCLNGDALNLDNNQPVCRVLFQL